MGLRRNRAENRYSFENFYWPNEVRTDLKGTSKEGRTSVKKYQAEKLISFNVPYIHASSPSSRRLIELSLVTMNLANKLLANFRILPLL